MPSVCALVLTRNRKQLLVECIEALMAQTRPVARILIVDNASSDGTELLLRERGLLESPRIELHRLGRNTGGAGGYAEAVRLGAETDADWLWLMDDDAEPRADALLRLLEAPPASDAATAVLCSKVVHPHGGVDALHRGTMGRFLRPLPEDAYRPGNYAQLGFASFVGFLVRADVVRRVGLPRAEFFIGCDDVDYSVRVRRHGAIVLVPESVFVHKLGIGDGAVTRRCRFWNRVLGLCYTSASWEGYWKNLYGLRNFMWIKHHYGHVSPLAFAGVTAAYVLRSVLYDARPLRRVPWLVRFAWMGRRGDFSGPRPAEWSQIARGASR